MLGQPGQFEVCCDAPLYAIVRACEQGGFRSPLDVRWCRLSHLAEADGQGQGNVGSRFWGWLLGRRRRRPPTCPCGQPLPDLKSYRFTFLSRKVGDYLLGQCGRCRTVLWDEALPLPAWKEGGGVRLTDSLEK